MEDKLIRYKKIWQEKKILRETYRQWFERIEKDLAPGQTLEVGSGIGSFKEFKPEIISSDLSKHDWLDMSLDAHAIPFGDSSLSNIVMIDVLHHLADPLKFFREAERVLKEGGRVLMIEPYPSPFSYLIYRYFHAEPFLFKVDYFREFQEISKDPWEANQAIPYLLFFKYRKRFEQAMNHKFNIIKRDRISFTLYPASGGFERKALAGNLFIPVLRLFEYILRPFARLLAFRCYVVLEKKIKSACLAV